MCSYFEEGKDDRKNYEGCKKREQKEGKKHNDRSSSGNASILYSSTGGRCIRIGNNSRYWWNKIQ